MRFHADDNIQISVRAATQTRFALAVHNNGLAMIDPGGDFYRNSTLFPDASGSAAGCAFFPYDLSGSAAC